MLTELNENQKKILAELIQKKRIRTSDLAQILNTTIATIHNYKPVFENLRVCYHRGFLSLEVSEKESGLSSLKNKMAANRVLKEAAVEYILKYLHPAVEDFVFINGGTTQYIVFRRMIEDGCSNINFITNNPLVVEESFTNPAVTEKNQVFVVGGKLDRQRASFYGSHTASSLNVKEIRGIDIDLCFLGVFGILMNGTLLIGNEAEVEQKKLLVRKSKRIIIAADQSKIEKRGWSKVESIEKIIKRGKEICVVVGCYDDSDQLKDVQRMVDIFGADIVRVVNVPVHKDGRSYV